MSNMKSKRRRKPQTTDMLEPPAGRPGKQGEALRAPEGTEFVEQLMVPVMISLGCSACRVLMDPIRMAPPLLEMPGVQQQPDVVYACPKCGKEARSKAHLPMLQHRRYEDTLELRDQMVVDDERQRSRAEESDASDL